MERNRARRPTQESDTKTDKKNETKDGGKHHNVNEKVLRVSIS